MWAMWANILKNFVRGPSAAVTFGARPYPGPSIKSQNAMRPAASKPGGHRPCGQQAGRPMATPAGGQQAGRPAGVAIGHRPCAISTLVGGRVDYVHKGRSLASFGAFCMV